MRIRKALPFQTNNLTGLRAFRNFDVFFAAQSGHVDFGPERGLSHGHRHSAMQIRILALEIGMHLDFENDVKIARRAPVLARLALTRNPESRVRIYTRGNPQIDRARALNPALPAAVRAPLAHNLPRAAAIGTGARDREETLLVMNLTAAAATLAGDHSCAFFCPGSVANFAEFETRQTDFRVDSRGRLFKTQFHVVTKIRTALRAVARAAPSENILEAKKISEDILKLLKYGLVDAAIKSAARKSRKSVTIVGDALLRLRQDRVGFGGFPKFFLRFLFLLRVAVRMPLQGCFAVGGFDFFGGSSTFDSEDFVAITFFTHRLDSQGSLICKCIWTGAFARMHDDANDRGPEHTPVKQIPVLKDVQDESVRIVRRFGALDGLVEMRIENLSRRVETFEPMAREGVKELLSNQQHTFAIFFVAGVVMRLQGTIESVENRNQIHHQSFETSAPFFMAIALDAFLVIFKIGLPANQRLKQVF